MEIETPWTPSEIKFLYEFKNSPNYNGWTNYNQGQWLEAERLLTYSETLRKMKCNCEVNQVMSSVKAMMEAAYPKIEEIYLLENGLL
jgi:hypothetical protein